MKTLYAACLSRLGLTQAGAATLHGVRLDTVKSWCAGRNRVPDGAWDDLRSHEGQIIDLSEDMRATWEAAGSPPLEIDDSEAGAVGLMAMADFVLGCDAPLQIGQTAATIMARQTRRPN